MPQCVEPLADTESLAAAAAEVEPGVWVASSDPDSLPDTRPDTRRGSALGLFGELEPLGDFAAASLLDTCAAPAAVLDAVSRAVSPAPAAVPVAALAAAAPFASTAPLASAPLASAFAAVLSAVRVTAWVLGASALNAPRPPRP